MGMADRVDSGYDAAAEDFLTGFGIVPCCELAGCNARLGLVENEPRALFRYDELGILQRLPISESGFHPHGDGRFRHQVQSDPMHLIRRHFQSLPE